MPDKAIFSRPAGVNDAQTREDKIAALVNAGGSSAQTEAEKKEIARRKRRAKKQIEPVVNVRVPMALLATLDALRGKRIGKISRNTWILEAIEDKIEREMQAREARSAWCERP